jgi:hypothetical protein
VGEISLDAENEDIRFARFFPGEYEVLLRLDREKEIPLRKLKVVKSKDWKTALNGTEMAAYRDHVSTAVWGAYNVYNNRENSISLDRAGWIEFPIYVKKPAKKLVISLDLIRKGEKSLPIKIMADNKLLKEDSLKPGKNQVLEYKIGLEEGVHWFNLKVDKTDEPIKPDFKITVKQAKVK